MGLYLLQFLGFPALLQVPKSSAELWWWSPGHLFSMPALTLHMAKQRTLPGGTHLGSLGGQSKGSFAAMGAPTVMFLGSASSLLSPRLE